MQVQSVTVQARILTILESLLQGWGLELEESITLETQLIQEVGLSSIDFIQLVVAIEDEFQEKLGFHELLMKDGKYVEDLKVKELITFIESKLNSTEPKRKNNNPVVKTPIQTQEADIDVERIDTEKIVQFRQVITSRLSQFKPNLHPETEQRNPPAVFILSPPRSGSTLLRVMLAGNSRLFAPPELHLLTYNTLQQRKVALSEAGSNHLLQGAIRAIVQLKNYSAQEAEKVIEKFENEGLTTKGFYGVLQSWAGDTLLVDKTPTYASHVDILQRAEIEFSEPLYIHLLRHPYGMIHSYTEAKLERVVPIMNSTSLSRQELAELTWLVSHENIIDFLQDIPAHRQLQVKFEDLVSLPQITIQNICAFLNLDFEPEMLQPYKEKSQRMTDGVHAASEMSGDLKFHLHQGIDANAAYRWQQYHTVNFLSKTSLDLTKRLGY